MTRLATATAMTITLMACEPAPRATTTTDRDTADRGDRGKASPNPVAAFTARIAGETFKHPYSIRITYDKVDDYTTLSLQQMPLGHHLDMAAYAVSPGPRWRLPAEVTLHIASSSDDWRYLNYSSLRFLLDDSVRIDLGDQEHNGTVGNGYVLEQFFPRLTIEQFLELAQANTVTGRLGITDFKLSTSQLSALRDFGSRMVDSAR